MQYDRFIRKVKKWFFLSCPGTWQLIKFQTALEWWSLSEWKMGMRRKKRKRSIWTDQNLCMIFHIGVWYPYPHESRYPCIKHESGEGAGTNRCAGYERGWSEDLFCKYHLLIHCPYSSSVRHNCSRFQRDVIWSMCHVSSTSSVLYMYVKFSVWKNTNTKTYDVFLIWRVEPNYLIF